MDNITCYSVYLTYGGDWMKRIDLYITEQQNKWLEKQVEKLGIKKSELVRRILDKEMKKKQ